MSQILHRKTLTRWVLAPGFALAVALSGCGMEDKAAEKLTEEAIEGAAGDGTEVDLDDEGITVTDETGAESSIGTTLPESFPVDEVPLVEGTIVAASAVDGASYTVMVELEGEPEEVQQEALGMLEDAGYSNEGEQNAEGYLTAQLVKEGFDVSVTSMDAEELVQVQYIVGVS